jgi:4-amino-4-deoxy-L-arabinose transferase-like glycosyltransferase
MPARERVHGVISHALTIPFVLALLQLVLQMLFHENYGYFRDELYYIACSNHLAFGYVDQPPLSMAILWVNRLVLGDSLHALRFLPALVGAAVVILAALMARRMGGGKFAQGLAALSVVAAHGLIGHGKLFSMNPFDVLFWALSGYTVITLLGTGRQKLWALAGVFVGLGLLNKYSVGFMVIGLVAGLLVTRQRAQLASRWFWAGGAIAAALFLPHVIWQVTHGLPSLEFMRNASENKNVSLGAIEFLLGQVRDMNIINAPLWLGGIYFFATSQEGRYRPLAWMYIFVFAAMVAGNAKIYYLSVIYPMYLASGSVLFEQSVRPQSAKWLRPLYVSLLILVAVAILPFALPVLPVDQFIAYEYFLGLTPRADERSSLAELPQYYADQFGWKEMADTVARAYSTLTPEEQSQCFIFARNYGEAAAIDFFGKKYKLPNAACAHNSYWHWGPGDRTGNIAIIIGNSRTLEDNLADLRRRYKFVELAGVTHARYCMPFEDGRMLFICKGMNTTFQKLWPYERFYI